MNIGRCIRIANANEPTIHQSPNDEDVTNYRSIMNNAGKLYIKGTAMTNQNEFLIKNN